MAGGTGVSKARGRGRGHRGSTAGGRVAGAAMPGGGTQPLSQSGAMLTGWSALGFL